MDRTEFVGVGPAGALANARFQSVALTRDQVLPSFLGGLLSILNKIFIPTEGVAAGRFRRRRPFDGLCSGVGVLLWLVGVPASAQTSEAAEEKEEARKPSPGSVLVGRAPSAPRTAVTFDVLGSHAFDGEVKDTSGSNMSSTSLYARIALLVPAGERLFLSFPIDAAVTFYEFSGDPRLLPGGGKPWDQVRTFSIGTQARYRFDHHWAVIAGANIASAGVRGASFEDTLSGGGTLGVAYSFSRELTLGVIVTAQLKLAGGLFVLPLPIIDWALPFDEGRWRLVAGALRVGPGRAAGVSIVYAPSESLAFTAGIAFLGLGREFRLASSSSVTNGVGRDSAYPVILGMEWRPVRQLAFAAYGGVSIFRAVTVLDGAGNTLNERDVKPSPVVGGRISLAL